MAPSRREAKGNEAAGEGEEGDQPARKASGCGGSGRRWSFGGFRFPREVSREGREVAERGEDVGHLGPRESEQMRQLIGGR